MIEVKDLRYAYDSGKNVLQGVGFCAREGETMITLSFFGHIRRPLSRLLWDRLVLFYIELSRCVQALGGSNFFHPSDAIFLLPGPFCRLLLMCFALFGNSFYALHERALYLNAKDAIIQPGF